MPPPPPPARAPGGRPSAVPILLFLFALFSAAPTASATLNITGLDPATFDSCDLQAFSQFSIFGSGLSGKCVFTDSTDTDFLFSLVPGSSPGTFLCSLAYLAPDTYRVGVQPTGGATSYGPQNVTVSPSPVSLSNSTLSFQNAVLAGQTLLLKVFPVADCGTASTCSSGNASFGFQFDGHPEIGTTFLGQIDRVCNYQTVFTAKGTYTFNATYNSTLFKTGSLSVDADITTLNQSVSSINVAELGQTPVGSQACVNLTLTDSYGNVIKAVSASQIALTWINSSVPNVQGKAVTKIGSIFRLCFTSLKAGTQYLDIKIGGISLNGCPVNVTSQPSTFDAASSWIRDSIACPPACTNPTLSGTATAGILSSFTIVPRDKYKNIKSDISDVTLALFNGSLVSLSGGPSYSVSVVGSGAYLVASFTPLRSGSYALQISYNGTALDGGVFPTVLVRPGVPSLTQSALIGTPLTTLAGASFTSVLMARDDYNNPVQGASWRAVLLNGLNETSCSVTETGSGNYQSLCIGLVAANYTLAFFLLPGGGQVTQTSPVTVLPSSISASTSLYGDYPDSASADSPFTLSIYTYDLYGNAGGFALANQNFQAQLQLNDQAGNTLAQALSSTLDATSSPNKFTVSFQLKQAGNYSVAVSFNGNPLQALKRPYILVLPLQTVGQKSLMTITNSPTADIPAVFTLYARDSLENTQAFNEASSFGVIANNQLASNVSVTCTIATTAATGVYNVTCPLRVVGLYVIFGSYQGVQSFTSDSLVQVPPGVVSVTTTKFLKGTSGQVQTVAGESTQIQIQGLDAFSNALTFSENFTVTIVAQNGSQILLTRTEDEIKAAQGISIYTYSISLAGVYTVRAIIGGQNILGSPSTLTVLPAPAAVSTATFTIDATKTQQGHIDTATSFNFYLKDSFANPVGTGDTVVASLIGVDFAGYIPITPVAVPGGYQLTFTPTVGGKYYLSLVVNGATVPANVTFEFFSSHVGICTDFDGTLNQGQKWDLTCTAYDQYGKPKKVGGDQLTWLAEGADVSSTDLGDGRYTVTFSSQVMGKHDLTILIGGTALDGMPLHPVVIPGPAVTAGVIIAMFALGVIIVGLLYWYRQRKLKQQQLLKKKRKPQVVFKKGGEDEWSDEEFGGVDGEEDWMRGDEPQEVKLKRAHSIVMSEIES